MSIDLEFLFNKCFFSAELLCVEKVLYSNKLLSPWKSVEHLQVGKHAMHYLVNVMKS